MLLIFEDESDIKRLLAPIVDDEIVEAVVHCFGQKGPYRLVKIPLSRGVVWSVFISKRREVFAYKSASDRWSKLTPGTYLQNGSRPQYNLARQPGSPRYTHLTDYRLMALAGWVPPGTKKQNNVRHLDEDVANSNATNLAYGTSRENAKDFARHKTLGTLPTKTPVRIHISRGTKQQVMRCYKLKGEAVDKKIESIILDRLQHDFRDDGQSGTSDEV